MTRMLSALVAATVVLALTGCGAQSRPEPEPATAPSPIPSLASASHGRSTLPVDERAPMLNDTPDQHPVSDELVRAARAFFVSYANYIYGHRTTIEAATDALRAQTLAAGPIPGMDDYTPVLAQMRVTSVHGGRASILAQFDDGRGPTTRPEIPATFTRQTDDTWLADAVAEEGME